MSSKLNELRANSTSGVPGLRLNTRRGHRVVDVAWYVGGRRKSTSYPIGKRPVLATERAMQKRKAEAGAVYDITPRQAWLRLSRSTY